MSYSTVINVNFLWLTTCIYALYYRPSIKPLSVSQKGYRWIVVSESVRLANSQYVGLPTTHFLTIGQSCGLVSFNSHHQFIWKKMFVLLMTAIKFLSFIFITIYVCMYVCVYLYVHIYIKIFVIHYDSRSVNIFPKI